MSVGSGVSPPPFPRNGDRLDLRLVRRWEAARLRHAQGQIYASPPRTAGPRFPAVAAALAQVSSGAAVDLTPRWLQTIVGLNGYDLNAWEAAVVRQIGAFADPLRACSAISAEAGAAIADTVTFGVFFLGVVGDEALCARRWLPGNSAVCYRLSWGMSAP